MTPFDAERPRRSALYLPASNPRAIAKARTLPCDMVILDLEDAVAPDMKAEARALAAAAVAEGGFGARELLVRVNAPGTPWAAEDAAMVRDAAPDGVVLPKVDRGADVADAVAATGRPVWAMVETGRAALDPAAIAAVPGLAGLVIGTNDLARELRMRAGADRLPLAGFLAAAIAAARIHGVAVLDGVFNGFDDPAGLEAECRQGLRFGFDGKTLIHPAQIDVANRVFAPGATDVARAETIVAAFSRPEAEARGAIRVGGEMVERLHLDEARRTLRLADRIAAAGRTGSEPAADAEHQRAGPG